MPTPIFVLGAPRTGTTWLANILCRHKEIAGIQANRHFGIHESGFFWFLKDRFGSLEDIENYNKLVDTFVKSDYFIISGLNKSLFFESPRPKTYQDFFRRFMDKYAEKESSKYWLEKTPYHSLYVKELSDYYPDAIFISIERDVVDKIKSHLKQHEKSSKLDSKLKGIIKGIISYRIVKVYLDELDKLPNKSVRLTFEELKNNKENTIQNLFRNLELNYYKELLEDKYRPNTSFSSKEERKSVLSNNEIKFIRKLFWLTSFMPSQIYKTIAKLYLSRCKYVDPPDWFWRKDRS